MGKASQALKRERPQSLMSAAAGQGGTIPSWARDLISQIDQKIEAALSTLRCASDAVARCRIEAMAVEIAELRLDRNELFVRVSELSMPNQAPANGPPAGWLRPKQVAGKLGTSVQCIHNWCNEAVVTAVRHGGQWFIEYESARSYYYLTPRQKRQVNAKTRAANAAPTSATAPGA